MFRKLILAAVSVVFAGALAVGGEEGKSENRFELGIDIGGFQATHRFEVDATLVQFYATASQWGAKHNSEVRLRLFTTSEADFDDGSQGSAKFSASGGDFSGLLGWGWDLGNGCTLSLFSGMTYRWFTEEYAWQDMDISSEFKTGLLTWDFGMRTALPLSDKVEWTSRLTLSPIIAGEAEENAEIFGFSVSGSMDVESGAAVEFRTGLTWNPTEKHSMYTGIMFDSVTFDLGDAGEHSFDKWAFQFGAIWRF